LLANFLCANCIAVLSLPKDDTSVAQFTQSKAKGTLVLHNVYSTFANWLQHPDFVGGTATILLSIATQYFFNTLYWFEEKNTTDNRD
jgi:putative flippase GtrA